MLSPGDDRSESGSARSAPPVIETNYDGPERETAESERTMAAAMSSNPREQIDNFLQRWMGIEVIKQSRIWDILIPGSHDSGTFECTHTAKGMTQRGLMDFIRSFVQTQEKSLYDQLLSGVRFLDLRVCLDPLCATKIPYCAHGGYRCISLIDALLDVRKFLTQNPSEIILISCKPDAGFKTGPYHMSLGVCDFWVAAILWDFMGDKLRSDTTIADLIGRKQQVVYFYSEVERYCPPHPLATKMHRLASQCSVKLETLDSVLGSPVIPRNAGESIFDGQNKQRKKIIRYDSGEYYSRHKLTAKHRNLNFEGSDWDLFTGVLRSYVVNSYDGQADAWSDEWEYDEEESMHWMLDRPKFGREYAFKFRCGEVHAASPLKNQSLDADALDLSASLNMQSARFPHAAKESVGPFRLRPQDAVRYKQMGLSRMFFDCPLRVKLSQDFLFVSYLRTGRTILTKSWGQTCENNAKFLIHKLKYWTQLHGRSVPRPPYRFRILAGEVTPPSPDFPQPGSELMRFWAQQSASALFFLPTGTRPNALACNKLLLSEILVPSIISRVNGITHDFISRKLVLTMLFHHVKFLRELRANSVPALSPSPAGPVDEDEEDNESAVDPPSVVRYEMDQTDLLSAS